MAPQAVHAAPGMALGEAGPHDVVRTSQLVPVRHLVAADVLEDRACHAGATQNPCGLDEGRSMNHAGGIDPRFAAGLEEQRYIEHHEATAVPGGSPQEAGLIPAHQGMDQGFKAGECPGITENPRAQALTVDARSPSRTDHHPGKGAADRPDSGATLTVKPVYTVIGIVDVGTAAGKHGGNGGLSHADRTCQAEYEHGSTPDPVT